MGLDASVGNFSFRAGSYSGFAHYRELLAAQVGMDLTRMVGFHHDGNFHPLPNAVAWTGNEPFYELLNHSDCEGTITPKQAKELLKDIANMNEAKVKLGLGEWFESYKNWEKAFKISVKTRKPIGFH